MNTGTYDCRPKLSIRLTAKLLKLPSRIFQVTAAPMPCRARPCFHSVIIFKLTQTQHRNSLGDLAPRSDSGPSISAVCLSVCCSRPSQRTIAGVSDDYLEERHCPYMLPGTTCFIPRYSARPYTFKCKQRPPKLVWNGVH